MLSSRQSPLAIIDGVWCAAGLVATHTTQQFASSPRRLELCVILFCDRDVFPGLFVALRKALEVQAICKFLTSSAIGVIAWTDDGTIFGERQNVWAGHPGRVEEHVSGIRSIQARYDCQLSVISNGWNKYYLLRGDMIRYFVVPVLGCEWSASGWDGI